MRIILKQMRVITLSILLIFIQHLCYGQVNIYIDSLNNIAISSPEIEEKRVAAYKIADWYRINERYADAREVAMAQIREMKPHTEDGFWRAKYYSLICNTYVNEEEFDLARSYIDKAEEAANQSNNKYAVAYAHYAEMILQIYLNNNTEAVELLNQILEIAENDERELTLITRTNYFLYALFSNVDDIENSLKYADNVVSYALKTGNKNDLANGYLALATCSMLKYKKDNRKEDLEGIFSYLDAGAKLCQTYPDYVAASTYTFILVNKASYLFQFYDYNDKDVREEITKQAEEVIRISEMAKDNAIPLANAYGILSDLHWFNDDLEVAEEYLFKSYNVLTEKENPYYYTLIQVVENLAKLNAAQGKTEKAYEYQLEVAEYVKLVYDMEEASALKRAEAQYQLRSKDMEIENLLAVAEAEKYQKNLYLGLLGIGVLGVIFLIIAFIYRLKYFETKRKQLEAEQLEAELKLQLQSEEEQRLRAEKELLRLQQMQLQDEVMASQMHLQYKNEVLRELKEKLDDNKEVEKILKEDNFNDEHFEKVSFQIQSVHPRFFLELEEKSVQKLSTLDKKYLTYMYLGMETKEIAQIMSVEPKSVRMVKYRLKKKFALDKDISLEEFLSKLVDPYEDK